MSDLIVRNPSEASEAIFDVARAANEQGKAFFSSVAADDVESGKLLYNVAENGTTKKLSEMYNVPFSLCNFTLENVEYHEDLTGDDGKPVIDEDGEPVQVSKIGTRTVLITSTGETIGSWSKQLPAKLANLVKAFGMPEMWPEGGLKVKFEQVDKMSNKTKQIYKALKLTVL